MSPLAYSLCQKPVIGVVLWASSLCVFEPPFSGVPIDLTTGLATAATTFKAPVDKRYLLAITFQFVSNEARLADQVVGDRYDVSCEGRAHLDTIPESRRTGLGRPIPFKVVIRKASDRSLIIDDTFETLCMMSHDGNGAKTRAIGWLALPVGSYIAEVTNLRAQAGLGGVRTSLALYSGQGK